MQSATYQPDINNPANNMKQKTSNNFDDKEL